MVEIIGQVLNPLTGFPWGNQQQSNGFKSLCDKINGGCDGSVGEVREEEGGRAAQEKVACRLCQFHFCSVLAGVGGGGGGRVR